MKNSRKNEKKPLRRILTAMAAAVLAICTSAHAAVAEESTEEYIFDTFDEYSTYAPGEILHDSFYYTDAWFKEAPETENDALALISMQVTAACTASGEDSYGALLLNKLGFSDIGFVNFNSEDPDDCAYTWARKTVGDSTLILVCFQSYALDSQTKLKGWKQNFTINDETSSGEHYAFSKAVDKATESIADLGSGNVKYWITGQSRGGALANLAAAKLPSKLNERGIVNKGIYAYTFESPAVTEETGGDYGYIHNYICSDDPVPKIPMWGMVRYGVDHELKTEETDANLNDELRKLNSTAADVNPEPYEDEINALVSQLEERVSAGKDSTGTHARADYSKERTDTFVDEEGNEISVTYNYQDTFRSLIGMIFGGDLDNLSMSGAGALLDELPQIVLPLVDAVTADLNGSYDEASPGYWQSAVKVRKMLCSLVPQGDVSMRTEDFYSLLRLIGPILIDSSYEAEDREAEAIMFIVPVLEIYDYKASLTYSHHFDTLIARLKTLAPQPDLDDIDIMTEQPKAGDSASRLAEEAETYIASLGHTWLLCEAALESSDEVLQDNYTYYLDVTLEAAGHLVTDAFTLTLNGEAPISFDISYEDGKSVIKAAFQFETGTPQMCSVAFETGNDTEAPDTIQVKAGTNLKYTERPAFIEKYTEDDKTWRFLDWQDENETAWDEITVSSDLTLYADWIRVIDHIQIIYPIPSVNDPAGQPVPAEEEYYYIIDWILRDENYDIVEDFILLEGEYSMIVNVAPVEGKAEFALSQDKWGYDYTGTAAIGDTEASVWCSKDGILELFISFIVPSQIPEYTVTDGDSQTYVKESEADAVFTVNRSFNDSETIERFDHVEIDETVIDEECYTAEAGSLKLTLKSSYLDTLSTGEHVVKAVFNDGKAEAKLIIEDAKKESKPDQESADTSDHTNRSTWAFLCLFSLAAAACAVLLKIKYRAN